MNPTRRPTSLRALALVLTTLSIGALAASCSLGNREGPDLTCAELECGRVNACAEGIITQCADGITVKYHVCSDSSACGKDWQVAGQYRCSEDQTDCEGCRPERTGCDDPSIGKSGSTSATGADGGGGAGGGR